MLKINKKGTTTIEDEQGEENYYWSRREWELLGMNKGKKVIAQDEEQEESNYIIGNEQGDVNYYLGSEKESNYNNNY